MTIQRFDNTADVNQLLSVIRSSFAAIAREMGFTSENAPGCFLSTGTRVQGRL